MNANQIKNMSDVSPAFKAMCIAGCEAMKIAGEKASQADSLLAQARVNDVYAAAARSPLNAAAHEGAAQSKRARAAALLGNNSETDNRPGESGNRKH